MNGEHMKVVYKLTGKQKRKLKLDVFHRLERQK